MLEILSQVLKEPLREEITASQAIGIELDARSFSNILLLYFTFLLTALFAVFVLFRYIDKEGQVFNQFLDIVAVSDGKADTIVTAVKDVLQKKQVPMEKTLWAWHRWGSSHDRYSISLSHERISLRKC